MYYELRDGVKSYELLLSDVKFNNDGTLKSGWVENGAWNFEIRGDEVLAKDRNYIVNRWPLSEYVLTPVPKELRGDYNDIMNLMEKVG
jgi:hypothetical protein